MSIAAILCAVVEFSAAGSFAVRDLQIAYYGRLSYGNLFRLEERKDDLFAIASGGTMASANLDDGNLNYGTGLVSSIVRATGEASMSWHGFGAYVLAAWRFTISKITASTTATTVQHAPISAVQWKTP